MEYHVLYLIIIMGSLHKAVSVFDRFHPELGKFFEGDIILLPEGRNAILIKEYLWPNGKVPYVFHSSYNAEEKVKVVAAMKGIEEKTCAEFVPHTTESDYVEFRKEPNMGCAAMVGRRPGRELPMIVNYQVPECLRTAGAMQHELLHVLGLFHEQARPDRDKYVTILWENIEPEFKRNFIKGPEDVVTTYNVPYDYTSLMHYPKTAFSKNGKNTIIAKDDPSLELGQTDGPTDTDFEKIHKLYNCISINKNSHGFLGNLLSMSIRKV